MGQQLGATHGCGRLGGATDSADTHDVANHRPAFDALAAAKGAIALPGLADLLAIFQRVGQTDRREMCQNATLALEQLTQDQSDINPLIQNLKKAAKLA